MSKVINRDNNLTSSAPSIVKSPPPKDSIELQTITSPNNNNNAVNQSTNLKSTSPTINNSSQTPKSPKESGFNTVSSYPTELHKLGGSGENLNPLSKAQELPYQVITLNDIDHSKDMDYDPDKSSEEEEEEEKKKKKKKKSFFKRLFSVKILIILLLVLLLLISAVGVIFRIFWPHIEIVQVQVLRWALYIDIAVVGYLLVYWIVRAFFSIFSSTMYLQQHVFYYVNGFVRPLSCLLWAVIVFFATEPVLELPAYTKDSMEKYYTALKAVMYVSLFYCGRVVLVKILAARTNRKAFYTSLKQSLLNEELLEQLSTRKPSALSQSVSASLKKKKKMGVSQWIESLKTRNQLSGKLNSRAEQFTQVEARKIAKQILRNADRDKKGYLVKDDLNGYVKEKHLEKAFNTIGSIHGDMIKKDDLTNWVLRVVRSRKTLEYRLRDHEDIGRVINEIVNFIFWVLMFLFVMTLYGVEVSVFLVPLSTTILALSFAFGTTLRNVFESLILIFFVRPYEVGDKVVINQLEALFVDRIGIVFTSFKTMDGKAVYLPNSVLVLARIENFQRSEDVAVGLDVTVNFNTPVEKLYMIEAKLDKWVKAQPEKWRPDIYMSFSNIIGTNQIVVRYGGSLIATWQDGRRIRILKNDFLFKMKEWLSDANFETCPAKQQIEFLNSPSVVESHFHPPNPIFNK
ncbi:hypothetical protein DICPUDRAFT_46057 [Dictyostelium purpureum]|uniref:EF-hand domain-containing protein n=1 Tax=Dictyostelium purpureum TaxID=5786 RepID=F0ZDC4_DICPU|nr:uncharacterized protein DICPUDRAFT_46057 [Dictyostelium purpureum]EGC38017.1 hypothetical protein DICPUDRAFT_46057 [Dictyostelium purpureum]|eukprot:XP_003285418.1 hypothetical protein DICPUDRAFT_46057 [Dictyostelium purpureum]